VLFGYRFCSVTGLMYDGRNTDGSCIFCLTASNPSRVRQILHVSRRSICAGAWDACAPFLPPPPVVAFFRVGDEGYPGRTSGLYFQTPTSFFFFYFPFSVSSQCAGSEVKPLTEDRGCDSVLLGQSNRAPHGAVIDEYGAMVE
jgi:hypothetical protein